MPNPVDIQNPDPLDDEPDVANDREMPPADSEVTGPDGPLLPRNATVIRWAATSSPASFAQLPH